MNKEKEKKDSNKERERDEEKSIKFESQPQLLPTTFVLFHRQLWGRSDPSKVFDAA